MAKAKKTKKKKTAKKQKRTLKSASMQPTTRAEFEAEDAAHTLMRAAEIESNPKLLKKAQGVIQKKLNALKKVAGQSQ